MKRDANNDGQSQKFTESLFTIAPDKLLPGDVILSTTDAPISAFIRTATGGDFSHAALHLGGGLAIEAVHHGVVPTYMPILGYPKKSYLTVMRMPDLSQDQREAVVRHAFDLLYRPYSVRGAAASLEILASLRSRANKGFFCSQLVAACYQAENLHLCGNLDANACTPAHLAASRQLRPQIDAIVEVDADLHKWSVSGLKREYAATLSSGNRYERAILRNLANNFAEIRLKTPFNLYDFARLLAEDSELRGMQSAIDKVAAILISSIIEKFPLAACPGISLSARLFQPTVWMPPIELGTKGFSLPEGATPYLRTSIENLASARRWEIEHWRVESEHMFSAFQVNRLRTFLMLAKWQSHCCRLALHDILITQASAFPGTIPREEEERIRAELRELMERHARNSAGAALDSAPE